MALSIISFLPVLFLFLLSLFSVIFLQVSSARSMIIPQTFFWMCWTTVRVWKHLPGTSLPWRTVLHRPTLTCHRPMPSRRSTGPCRLSVRLSWTMWKLRRKSGWQCSRLVPNTQLVSCGRYVCKSPVSKAYTYDQCVNCSLTILTVFHIAIHCHHPFICQLNTLSNSFIRTG